MWWKQLNVEPKIHFVKEWLWLWQWDRIVSYLLIQSRRSNCCECLLITDIVILMYLPVVSIWNLIHLKTMTMQWFRFQTTRIGYQRILVINSFSMFRFDFERHHNKDKVSFNHGYCLLNSEKGTFDGVCYLHASEFGSFEWINDLTK